MSLRFFYIAPGDLFNKMEREAKRLFDAASESRKDAMCDHFFNFCVTAHSIRDWVIKTQGCNESDLHARCNKSKELAACRDIANANKHFALDTDRKTVAKGAAVSTSSVVDVFEDREGNYHLSDPRETLEISIVIEGVAPQESHQFTENVIAAWKAILSEFNIPFQSIYNSILTQNLTQ